MLELPFYQEGHHFIRIFFINWRYPGSGFLFHGGYCRYIYIYIHILYIYIYIYTHTVYIYIYTLYIYIYTVYVYIYILYMYIYYIYTVYVNIYIICRCNSTFRIASVYRYMCVAG